MAEYIKVYETSNAGEVNAYIRKGWTLIDTCKVVQSDEYGEPIGSYTKYTLGYTSKEYTNRLLAIIEEYEKHGLKEVLFEKVATQMDDNLDDYETVGLSENTTPLGKYMSDYEEVVNDNKVFYVRKEWR